MSRDLVVYAENRDTVPSDDIVADLRALGLSIEWQRVGPSNKAAQWTRAVVRLAGSGDDRVEVSTNALEDAHREYLSGLSDTGTYTQTLADSRRQYFLSAIRTKDANADRVLNPLAQVIARRSNGIIHDQTAGRYYGPEEFGSSSGIGGTR